MSKIVELYVRELTREGSTMTINDVPKKLRKQVEDAIAAIEAAANAGTAKERASQEHRQHEAQDPQVPWAGGLRQDDTRQRRAILRELDGPHLTRQHLPPAAEHGRLFLQLFPGAQTITERRHNSWPKN